MRFINDLSEEFRTGLRVQWRGKGVEGIVLFWPEEREGFTTLVTALFDSQSAPIQVPATELIYPEWLIGYSNSGVEELADASS